MTPPADFGFVLLAITALIFLFAALIHGSIGLGFPIVATPLLALFTNMQTAIVLTLMPTILANLVSISREGNVATAFRRYFPMALLAMAGSAVGTQILLFTHSGIFKALLAIAIVIYLLAEKIRLNFSWVREHPNFAKITFGTAAGMLGGLTNVMGPLLIIYSLESRHSKSETVQASNICFMFGKAIQLFLFSVQGKFTQSELSISLTMLLLTGFALYLGVKIRKVIQPNAYKKILRILLLLVALVLLAQVFFSTV